MAKSKYVVPPGISGQLPTEMPGGTTYFCPRLYIHTRTGRKAVDDGRRQSQKHRIWLRGITGFTRSMEYEVESDTVSYSRNPSGIEPGTVDTESRGATCSTPPCCRRLAEAGNRSVPV